MTHSSAQFFPSSFYLVTASALVLRLLSPLFLSFHEMFPSHDRLDREVCITFSATFILYPSPHPQTKIFLPTLTGTCTILVFCTALRGQPWSPSHIRFVHSSCQLLTLCFVDPHRRESKNLNFYQFLSLLPICNLLLPQTSSLPQQYPLRSFGSWDLGWWCKHYLGSHGASWHFEGWGRLTQSLLFVECVWFCSFL